MPESDRRLAVEVRGLCVDYATASGPVRALSDVDASFRSGALSVVAGPSGSGKSSLLWAVAGLRPPRQGSVVVAGRELTRLRARARRRLRRHTMGIVLQDPADNLVEYLTAIEQVTFAARMRGADPAGAGPVLAALGLAHRFDARPQHLSGGEQQRVAFAAGAVGDPVVLLADEPTAELDAEAGATLVAAMRSLVDRGASLVVTSHDHTLIDAADHVVWLRDGEVER